MYRILLADDEGIMLESLKKIIETEYGNECEIHCAKSGRVVVEMAQAYPPDICFMDIQMPGISGIQAIREIQKFNSSAVFVIITAYDKFNYAKEAVNLGVQEFLTKPVNKKVILETCAKMMTKVDQIRQKRSDDLLIREKLETVVPMIESGYINNILLQDDFVTYQDNYTQLLDIRQKYGYMMVIEFGDSMENGVLSNAVGASVKANKFYSTFREIAQGFFECLVGPIMGNRIVLLVPYENAKEDYEDRVAIVTRARNMVHKFENRIDSMFRCGIGRVKELGGVKESFKEAVVALRESISHVVHIEDVPAAQKYDGEYPRDLEIRYQKRILEKDAAGAMNCAEGFFEWMHSQQAVTREDIEIKILEMVMNAERRAFFAGTLKYNVNSRRSYIRELQSCTDIENLKKWFLDKTREICTKLENSKEKEAGSIIDRAKEYINENFRRDISLDDVSREVDISPYYFSKLFKQETGKNFIEYLTEIRLKNARELGAEVNVQDAGADVKEQISQIEYFINKQVDVIVVIARDCGALSDAIQKAQSAGIPVISYDRMVNNANTDLYISFDNRKVGEIMAQALVNALPQGGDIFMIQGSSSDNNVQMVKQGFDDMLADTDLHVVYEANCDGWTAELAAGYVEEALEKYPHVKGIMCGNDDIASQVVQVLAENQLAGNVVVVGQDGDLAACQRIVEGTQYMTAFKPIEDLARKAAKYAVEIGSGKGVSELEDVTETVNDGTYEIPSCILEPTAVTKENIDKVIIEGGFHRRDEVYLNADYS